MKLVLFSLCSALLVSATAVYAADATAPAPKGPNPLVKLTTDFPPDVNFNVMPGHNGMTTVKFKIKIENGSRHDETLTAATPCDVRSWRILDASGAENQKMQKGNVCIEPIVSLPLPAGTSFSGPADAAINGKLLKDGAVYTFEYTYFGYKSENKFTAHLAQ